MGFSSAQGCFFDFSEAMNTSRALGLTASVPAPLTIFSCHVLRFAGFRPILSLSDSAAVVRDALSNYSN